MDKMNRPKGFNNLEKLNEEELRSLIKSYLKELDVPEIKHMIEVFYSIKKDVQENNTVAMEVFSEWDIKNNDLLLELFEERLHQLCPSNKKN